ncbi:MAG: carboxypeptidase regulatory-like domain-containing protein, partial [Myxococcales bacterium]|nr:carboxypeptidase regulatory-like domain-containing protein [Myxococcales bacterium]
AWLVAHTRAAITGTAEVIQTQRDGLAALPALLGASGTDDDAPVPPGGTSAVISSGPVKLEGRVVDDQKRPVAGAEVTLDCGYDHGQADVPLPRATTSALGAFTFEADAGCLPSITAVKNDRMIQVMSRSQPLELVLAPRLVIAVHVVDAETGAGIGNAEVSTAGVLSASYRNSATTNASGHAELYVPWMSGGPAHRNRMNRLNLDKEIFARAHGYVPMHVDAENQPAHMSDVANPTDHNDPPVTRTIRLVRGIVVRGQLIGAATTEARLDVVGPLGEFGPAAPDGPWTRRKGLEADLVDADGRFEIRVPAPGRYRIRPHAPSLGAIDDAETSIEVGPGGRSDVVIHVGTPSAKGITGIVLDPSGHPVAGAQVSPPLPMMAPVTTDARGQFSIPSATALGGPYSLLARHGSLASEILPVDLLDKPLTHMTFRLAPAGISGVVVDDEGYVVPGAEVYRNVTDDFVSGDRATTDAEGRFSFDVPRGSFVLSVRRSSEHDFLDEDDRIIAGGTHNVRLVVP